MEKFSNDNIDMSDFKEQYNRVSRFFDANKRIPPEPYLPETKDRIITFNNTGCLNINLPNSNTTTIYIHIPFCDRKCNFCDLYSFYLPENKREFIDRYINSLVTEINLWGNIIDTNSFNVSTIHFGGGSPLILEEKHFQNIFSALHKNFTISTHTEVALEMTSSDIKKDNLKKLSLFSFRRIHVGIQTFNKENRIILGRKEQSTEIVQKIEVLKQNDFIISADVLYGLPFQDFSGFQKDLEQFISLDIDGFALYELTKTKNLQKKLSGIEKPFPITEERFYMFLEGKKLLNELGYQNVFFNHFGNERDKNLYFTFPIRGESCFAFGAISDGRIGNFFYRNNKIATYLNNLKKRKLEFSFSYFEKEERKKIRLIEEQLMASRILKSRLQTGITSLDTSLSGMIDYWTYTGLIQPKDNESFELTGSGCWFLSDMLTQVRRLDQS